MRRMTIVAGYGAKSPRFARLLRNCQTRLGRALGASFRPYPLPQIHATLVGLEQDPGCCDRHRLAGSVGIDTPMDITGFVEHLIDTWRPLPIRFGGFSETDRPFASRGTPPFARSFSLQRDKAVLIGWPIEIGSDAESRRFPQSLERIRRHARRFGIVHAYHVEPDATDNDYYLRVGLLDEHLPVSAERLRDCETAMRGWLSQAAPVIVDLTLRDLSVVRYSDETLPGETSQVCRLSDTGLLRRWLARISHRGSS